MKKAKQVSNTQKMLNVINTIQKLLNDSDELGDFGKTKTIPAISLKLSLDALDHLKTLTQLKESI